MNRVLSYCANALLLAAIWLLPNLLTAQEMILTDEGWAPAPFMHTPVRYSANKSGQIVDTLNLPFFDDFSTDSLMPDSRKWFIDNNEHHPFISQTKAIQPPTKGVLTFNGSGGNQQIYNCNDRATGFTDSIVSLPIDLSSLDPSDDVYLSFRFQPGGLVDNPENDDMLLLYFQGFDSSSFTSDTIFFRDTTVVAPADTVEIVTIDSFYDITGTQFLYADTTVRSVFRPEQFIVEEKFKICFDEVYATHWDTVWFVNGDSASNSSFTNVIVRLDSVDYFFDAFKFKIAAFGNLNGQFDNWHVDYVYLNEGRNATDTTFSDASVLFQSEPLLLNGYTAVPLEHLQNHSSFGNHMGNAQIQVRNMGTSTENRTVTFELSDPVGNNFTPQIQTENVSIPPRGFATVNSQSFSNQNFTQYGDYQLKAVLNSLDQQGENDSMIFHYPIDSVLAYDDGQAEEGYGLGSTRGYAMRFVIDQPDTMTAAWIQFVPAVHYNATTAEITCLDGYGFRLNIWDHNPFRDEPDTLLEQQLANMTVDYGTGPGQFVRYSLNDTLIVSDTFYVGISQVDDKPLGVGLDKTFDNTSRFFYQDGGGQWTNSTIGGTLMIRPEFGTFVDPFAVGEEEKKPEVATELRIIPNPSSGGSVKLDLPGISNLLEGQIEVIDLRGQRIFQTNSAGIGLPYQIQFDRPLASGMYLVKIHGKTSEGVPVQEVGRMVIH